MEIESMHVTSSGERIKDIDLLSQKIIIYGIKKADGLVYDGTFVLKELVTMIDSNGDEVNTKQWEAMAHHTITYNGEQHKILDMKDPILEKKLDGILRNGIHNLNEQSKRGLN